MVLPASQQPKEVPPQVKNLLIHAWKDKELAPRIQTFAWRLLRRALPTGKRAGRFSNHIGKECSRCGLEEDEVHLFFLCPFAKAAWFSFPWFIRTEIYATDNHSIPSIVHAIISSGHPHATVAKVYTFLWCLWKSRNDVIFGRKVNKPCGVFAATNAILQGALMKHPDMMIHTLPSPKPDLHSQPRNCLQPGAFIHNLSIFSGSVIFSDAAWKPDPGQHLAPAGLGVFIKNVGSLHCRELHIAAISPPVSSALQAEAFALLLGVKVSEHLNIQITGMFTDNKVLSRAAAANNVIDDPGHWEIAPLLTSIFSNRAFDHHNIFHVARHFNFKADFLSKLALRLLNRSCTFRCLCISSTSSICPVRDALSDQALLPIRLVSVKCC
jgi:hypothetical protein